MENISKAIKALFVKMSGDEILKYAGFLPLDKKGHLEKDYQRLDAHIPESIVVNKLLQVDFESTIDQLNIVYQIIQDKWVIKDKSNLDLEFRNSDSVFNALLHFASKCLVVKDGEPLCQYRTLLRWHLIAEQVGEDLLTTAFIASHDIKRKKRRSTFDWSAYLGHDCKELNYIFEKPMAELHMHLKGSSYNFDLSWSCLMNHIGIMQSRFESEHPLHPYIDPDKTLYEKVRRAAAIRYYLAVAVGCVKDDLSLAQLYSFLNDKVDEKNLPKKKEEREFRKNELGIKKEVDFLEKIDKSREKTKRFTKEKFEQAKINQHFSDQLTDNDIIDYIPVLHYESEPIENKVLAPERALMYSVFSAIYGGKEESSDIATLFYAYLAYKTYFRNAIIQLNERVGFANFASYEERKTDYILEDYYHLLYKAAIEGFLEKGTDRYIEARVVPKDTEEGIVRSLSDYCKEIDEKYNKKYSFIFHFIKQRDEPKEKEDFYRHYDLRHAIKKQAYAIYQFRSNRKNWGGDNLVGKVVGLDAANSEVFCRPEVYAQAFRFLRGHDITIDEETEEYPKDLNITYHAGEDYMDIADGLRAVEEAMLFLNLGNGDRLGHALVLGTDVRSYYEKRYYTICASKQVLLDNLAWLHHKCIRLTGYTQLCGWLDIMFLKYFDDIYGKHDEKEDNIIDSFFTDEKNKNLSDDINDYYLSWLLRGDSPVIGIELATENLDKATSTIDRQWAYAGMNHQVCAEVALKNERARQLFDAYHSYKYANRGYKGDTLTIPPMYRDEWYMLLEKIQQQLLDKVEKRHIAIECNPSSNFKIGEIERYDEHPIAKFFNYGLKTPYPRHDIAVSINTDDQGVFATSLEREYSLMALAIERNRYKEYENSPRAIWEWLDRVRELSMEQRFNKIK